MVDVPDLAAAPVIKTKATTKFDQQTLGAWQDYQTTGLHVTHGEVLAWLQSWGTAHELPPPVCHH